MSICSSKTACGWLSALSQVAIAAVVVYAGYVVNKHMEEWTAAFKQGSEDLHKIQQSMQDIDHRMYTVEQQMVVVNKQLTQMNGNVGGMKRRMNPMGFFMPW